ncbi:Retrovirus-related Pol polyprotein from transposon 297 [Eumeta japonica]|uniref:Retrovirus-related Pol polyprotein from transposon 297 n=1 Tax=Eumeta variegata TaxID=151549 RepID=A0A4C1X608_EUMVA|nr:Retrovirus-related Pol polyprotein from transposon 297 [Eumeta japonica]
MASTLSVTDRPERENTKYLFPRSAVQQRRTRTTYQLSAANGTTINTYRYVNLELNLSLRRAYPWRFVVADVTKPIIGADFLQFYNLMVDIRNRRLIDNTTTLSTSGSDATSSSTISSVKILLGDTRYDKLLAKFPDITRPSGTLRSSKHNTVHFIKTTSGPPVSSPPRRLASDKLQIAKCEFEAMLKNGTARPSKSCWSSPLHLAPKKESGRRPCGDYRMLNARTIPDRYPIRYIQDFSHNITGSKVFSTIDLVKAYNQIPINVEDISKTAIATPFGLYEFSHISGRDNVVADTLSRIEQLDNVVDFVKLANAQESDPELEQILKDGSALQLQKIHVPGTKTDL